MLWQSSWTAVFVWRKYGVWAPSQPLSIAHQQSHFCFSACTRMGSLTVASVSIESIGKKNTFHRQAQPQHCGVGIDWTIRLFFCFGIAHELQLQFEWFCLTGSKSSL